MAKSSAAAGLSAEEIGFLAGGPGRAAEAALARLLDGGLVRVSREGLVTAVHQNGYGATSALEASILAGSQGTARPLQQVVQTAVSSQEMGAVRYGLADRAMVRRQGGKARGGQRALRVLLSLGVVIAIVASATYPYFLVLAAVLLFLVILMRDNGILTAIGKGVLGHARRYPRGRVDAVALYGLRGVMGHQRVCDLFGLPSLLFHPAPVYLGKQKSTSHSSCGGGGGVYEHHHYNCGSSSSSCSSNSCSSSSSSSSCSSSSSSCSSSSSSSCSSSSS